MVVVKFRVDLEAGSVSAGSGSTQLGQSRNSPGGRWKAALTGPLTMPAWKPALASPNEIVEAMRM